MVGGRDPWVSDPTKREVVTEVKARYGAMSGGFSDHLADANVFNAWRQSVQVRLLSAGHLPNRSVHHGAPLTTLSPWAQYEVLASVHVLCEARLPSSDSHNSASSESDVPCWL